MEAVDKWCSRFDVDRRGTSGAQPQPRQAQIPGKTRPNFSCGSSCYKTHHILPLHAHTRFKVTWSYVTVFIRAGRVQTLQNIVLIQECLWCFRRLRRGSGQTSFSFLDFYLISAITPKKKQSIIRHGFRRISMSDFYIRVCAIILSFLIIIIIYSVSTYAVMFGEQHLQRHVGVKCSHNTVGDPWRRHLWHTYNQLMLCIIFSWITCCRENSEMIQVTKPVAC